MADRTSWSSNAHFSVVASVIQSSSADVEDFVITPSTGRHARSLNRQAISSEIKQSFTPPIYAVVHWDRKIIKDSMDQNKDHVAVAISGSPDCKNGKLFGVKKTKSCSDVNQANAVSNLLEEWNCSDDVIGLSFDSTSSNTGRINGAAVLLEDRPHKKLLWLACRDHIMELIISNVATNLFGKSTGPEDMKFKDFKATGAIWTKQNLIYHHARWMAKVLYCLKMFMFGT